jgi:hypothetical protein
MLFRHLLIQNCNIASSLAAVCQCVVFFLFYVKHDYYTTAKTLTLWDVLPSSLSSFSMLLLVGAGMLYGLQAFVTEITYQTV